MKSAITLFAGIATILIAFAVLGAELRHAVDAAPAYSPTVIGDLAIGILAAGCSIATFKGLIFWIEVFSPSRAADTDAG